MSGDLPPADVSGFDLKPDPLEANSPAELAEALRRYRAWCGDPSLRDIARRAGGRTAPSTIWQALRADGTVPRLEVVLAVVVGCGGIEEDQRRFATAWRAIRLTTV